MVYDPALNFWEVGYVAVVHECINTEYEGMVVVGYDACSTRSTDMGKYYFARGIGADGAKVRVVDRGLDGFVEGRMKPRFWGISGRWRREIRERRCIPHHSEAIGIKRIVYRLGYRLGGNRVGRKLGNNLWDVVLINLFDKGVGRSWYMISKCFYNGKRCLYTNKDIIKKTGLGSGNIREPTTHFGRLVWIG